MIIEKEVLLIVLVGITMGVCMKVSDWRRKKQEERQARLDKSFRNSQS